MSGSNRCKFVKIAGLACLLIVGSLFTYTLTIPVGRALNQEAANRANIHRQNAEDRIIGVCSSPAADPFCVEQTRKAQRENERAEEDLGAQKVSAWWAQVMGVAALIGMALSAVGVWLIKTTFHETQKANEIARESLEGASRPWVHFTVDWQGIQFRADGIHFVMRVKLSNCGQSPAIGLNYIVLGDFNSQPSELIFNRLPDLFIAETISNRYSALFPGDEWEKDCSVHHVGTKPKKVPVSIIVAVRYQTPFSSHNRYTCRIFDLHSAKRGGGALIDFDTQYTANGSQIAERSDISSMAT
jgi:hypothetical protein